MKAIRRIVIGTAALIVVLLGFAAYNHWSRTPELIVGSPESDDQIPPGQTGPNPPQLGQVRPGRTEMATFAVTDPTTKKLRRLFGFRRLLNPNEDTVRWRLEAPFMNIYEDRLFCRITADRGTVQVEKVEGSYAPRDAELSENVQIYLRSIRGDEATECVITMNDLNYSSERSLFSTAGPVKVVSPQAELAGVGMELIYNPGKARIELMRIADLDYLRIRDVVGRETPEPVAQGGTREGNTEEPGRTQSAAISAGAPRPQAGPGVESEAEQTVAASPGAPAGAAAGTHEQKPAGEHYFCRFEKNVVIWYGQRLEVTGAEDVDITNILWSRRKTGTSERTAGFPKRAAGSPAEAGRTSGQAVGAGSRQSVAMVSRTAQQTMVSGTAQQTAAVGSPSLGQNGGPTSPASQETATSESPAGTDDPLSLPRLAAEAGYRFAAPEVHDDDTVDVRITCDGSLIVRPMEYYEDETAMKGRDGHRARLDARTGLFYAGRPGEDRSGGRFETARVGLAGAAIPTVPDAQRDTQADKQTAAASIRQSTSGPERKPSRFSARNLRYDVAAGRGTARGPIEFTFHVAPPDPNAPNAEPVPVVITATDRAEYEREPGTFTFFGSVTGMHEVTAPQYVQRSTFYGKRLIVRLAESLNKRPGTSDIAMTSVTTGSDSVPVALRDDQTATVIRDGTAPTIVGNTAGSAGPAQASRDRKRSDVRSVTLVGGNVRLESIRTRAGRTLSHVRLRCVRVDYDAAADQMVATGPGNIELNNEGAEPIPADQRRKPVDLRGPGYGLMQGFAMLRWQLGSQRVTATGSDPTEPVQLAYQPIVEGQLDRRIWAAAPWMEVAFTKTAGGGSQLSFFEARGHIFYSEEDGNVFLGTDTLRYDEATAQMVVSCHPQDPCFLNGAMVSRIDYDLKTGRITSELTGSPGVVPLATQPDQ